MGSGAKRRKTQRERDWLDEMVDEFYARMETGERPGIAFLLEELLNRIMERERDRFLQSLLQRGEKDYANGFYPRNLYLTLGQLHLKVPRVRFSKSFRPAILPPRWKRIDRDYEELLIAMLANGYSLAQIQRTLKQLRLPFSQETLQDVQNLIQDKLDFYKSQPLKSDWFAIFIDAYWGKLRTESGKVEDIALFVAVGIDLEGHKEILGFWTRKGRENKGFWVEVLQDLLQRGVHRVLLFVTDDFRGVHEVLQNLFPDADHQICLLHLERNLRQTSSGETFRNLRTLLRRIRNSQDEEEGHRWLDQLLQTLETTGQKQKAASLAKKRDQILAFLRYPEEVRRHIYSTNVVESLNAGIELMRLELGGYFPSLHALEVNLFIQVVNLQDRWWRRPIPTIRSQTYRLRQIFSLRYELDQENHDALHNF